MCGKGVPQDMHCSRKAVCKNAASLRPPYVAVKALLFSCSEQPKYPDSVPFPLPIHLLIPLMKNTVRPAILGLLVGDALGVPAEFKSRETLKRQPVTGMTGFGTHNQPPGTWSDDGSLTLCLVDALCEGYNLGRIARSFTDWFYEKKWTPHGEVFDIGNTTLEAISRLKGGVQPDLAGGNDEQSNGNGSLMRILPLLFYIRDKPEAERFERTRQVSALTHAHIRSVLACFYYLEYARLILAGENILEAYAATNRLVQRRFAAMALAPGEVAAFDRILKGDIHTLAGHEIIGSGYVIHSLEASLWCVMTSSSYPEAVLKAVNLGEDTDTTGAITGGLAGLVFGMESIPEQWISQIARINEIEKLIHVFAASLSQNGDNAE